MEYEKVTETIIGCAYRVYNKMGFGFLESVYEIGEKKFEIKRKVKDLNCTASAFPASSLSERSGDPDSSGLERSGNPASGAAGNASESKNGQNSLQSKIPCIQLVGTKWRSRFIGLERSGNPAQRGCRELQLSDQQDEKNNQVYPVILSKIAELLPKND